MSDDKIYWIAVDFDHVPTGDEMREVAEAIKDELPHTAIITTREVEPMDKDEVRGMLE